MNFQNFVEFQRSIKSVIKLIFGTKLHQMDEIMGIRSGWGDRREKVKNETPYPGWAWLTLGPPWQAGIDVGAE